MHWSRVELAEDGPQDDAHEADVTHTHGESGVGDPAAEGDAPGELELEAGVMREATGSAQTLAHRIQRPAMVWELVTENQLVVLQVASVSEIGVLPLGPIPQMSGVLSGITVVCLDCQTQEPLRLRVSV